jgi:uncharacterized protein (DUF58 family)
LEARVAIGLVLMAGLMALPIAVGAWILGLASFGDALLIYVLAGWSVVAAGFLSTLFGQVAQGSSVEATGERQPVPMKVKSANRG